MSIKTRSRLIVLIFSFLVWVALTDIKDGQEIITGIIVATLVSIFSGHFLFTNEKNKDPLKRVLYFLLYIVTFIWEMIKANLHVAYIVIHPKLPIKPGIVKVRTCLTRDSAVTILANSITLTPGTLTVDIGNDNKEMYIHWITVKSDNVEDASKEICSRFEKVLKEVFE
jgi:multicomponent Na+:H+ antiporter subunit E